MNSYSNSIFYSNQWLYFSYLSGLFNQSFQPVLTQIPSQMESKKQENSTKRQSFTLYSNEPKKLENILIRQQEKNSNFTSQKIIKQEQETKKKYIQEDVESQSEFSIKKNNKQKNKKAQLQKQKSQKENRNRNSNIIRSFFKFLNGKVKQPGFIRTLIKSKGLNIQQRDFLHWLGTIQPDFRNYIRNSSMKRILTQIDAHPSFNFLMRILFHHFLKFEYKMILLNSNKMTWDSALKHLQGSREILNELLNP